MITPILCYRKNLGNPNIDVATLDLKLHNSLLREVNSHITLINVYLTDTYFTRI